VRLGWIKTYDGAHSVLCLGKLASGNRITGTWQLVGASDRFALEQTRRWEDR
jgi:hypothetical protein